MHRLFSHRGRRHKTIKTDKNNSFNVFPKEATRYWHCFHVAPVEATRGWICKEATRYWHCFHVGLFEATRGWICVESFVGKEKLMD